MAPGWVHFDFICPKQSLLVFAMPFLALPYPIINPVAFAYGPVVIRWYALAYIVGICAGYGLIVHYCRKGALWGSTPHPDPRALEDLLTYCALGIVLGGRLGQVLFYDPHHYFAHPLEIVEVWKGGMAFHGGLLGAALGAFVFARRARANALTVFDLCAAVTPIGLFLGRLANFIRPELWGHESDVPWAMVFPQAGPMPRHPSQLYEAGLEGIALFVLLTILVHRGHLRKPGFVAGAFGVGYGCARIFCEFFREPDPQLEALGSFLTMGMVLSVPMIGFGLALMLHAIRRQSLIETTETAETTGANAQQ